MLPVIEKLLVLQDRDRRLNRLQAELDAIGPLRASLLARAAKTQSDFDLYRQRGKQLESDRKKLELEASSKQQFIDKCKTQQAATKKNEEYRSFQHQIDITQGEIRALDDQQLEFMEKAEKVTQEIAAADLIAQSAKAEVTAALTVLSQREQNLVKEMEVADGERTKVAADVEPFALSRYERLLNTKGENVVVGVPRGICGGCHMKQTTQVVVEVKGQQDIVTCISCGRILFFTSDMD